MTVISFLHIGWDLNPHAARTYTPAFPVAFTSDSCYAFGAHTKEERNILSQGGYDEKEILDRDPYRCAAAEYSAGDDAVGRGGRYVIVGDLCTVQKMQYERIFPGHWVHSHTYQQHS